MPDNFYLGIRRQQVVLQSDLCLQEKVVIVSSKRKLARVVLVFPASLASGGSGLGSSRWIDGRSRFSGVARRPVYSRRVAARDPLLGRRAGENRSRIINGVRSGIAAAAILGRRPSSGLADLPRMHVDGAKKSARPAAQASAAISRPPAPAVHGVRLQEHPFFSRKARCENRPVPVTVFFRAREEPSGDARSWLDGR